MALTELLSSLGAAVVAADHVHPPTAPEISESVSGKSRWSCGDDLLGDDKLGQDSNRNTNNDDTDELHEDRDHFWDFAVL